MWVKPELHPMGEPTRRTRRITRIARVRVELEQRLHVDCSLMVTCRQSERHVGRVHSAQRRPEQRLNGRLRLGHPRDELVNDCCTRGRVVEREGVPSRPSRRRSGGDTAAW